MTSSSTTTTACNILTRQPICIPTARTRAHSTRHTTHRAPNCPTAKFTVTRRWAHTSPKECPRPMAHYASQTKGHNYPTTEHETRRGLQYLRQGTSEPREVSPTLGRLSQRSNQVHTSISRSPPTPPNDFPEYLPLAKLHTFIRANRCQWFMGS